MKILTLNLWGGIVFEPLMRFLEKQSETADVFCFQEMIFGSRAEVTQVNKARMNLFSEIEKRLPDFVSFTYQAPDTALHFQGELLEEGTRPGQAIFVRKGIHVTANGGFRCYEQDNVEGMNLGGKITGSCQWIEILDTGNEKVAILNLHGLWQEGTHKNDTPERMNQSLILKNFLDQKEGKKILCGDFNLNPETESLKILEDGMVNLVAKYRIPTTRTSFYAKEGKFASYILISSGIKETNFTVSPEEVSDHSALMLEF